MSERSPSDAKPLAGRRIVVVDDNADSRETLRMALEASGAFAIVIPSTERERAVSIVAAARPHAVLIDVAGGRRGRGVWLFTRIRAAAGLADVPVVAITGHREREDDLRALGFSAVLTKPVEPSALGGLLQSGVGRRPGPVPRTMHSDSGHDQEERRVADALVGTVLCLTCLGEKTALPERSVRRVLTALGTTVVVQSHLPCDLCRARFDTYGVVHPASDRPG
jgi:CheY-like chemotaxis protein